MQLYWDNQGADAHWTTLEGNWWTDENHTEQASSLPAAGDSIRFDADHGSLPDTGPASATQFGDLVSPSGHLILPPNVHLAAGASIVVANGGLSVPDNFVCAGAMLLQAAGGIGLNPGWKVNGGAAGGTISLQGGGGDVTVGAPDQTSQIKRYASVIVQAEFAIDLSAMGDSQVTGAWTIAAGFASYAGPKVTLAASGASFNLAGTIVDRAGGAAGGMLIP
jgi:hypothetical protein